MWQFNLPYAQGCSHFNCQPPMFQRLERLRKQKKVGEVFTFRLLVHTLGTQTLHTCSKENAKMKIRQNYKNIECIGFPLKRRLSGQKRALEPL